MRSLILIVGCIILGASVASAAVPGTHMDYGRHRGHHDRHERYDRHDRYHYDYHRYHHHHRPRYVPYVPYRPYYYVPEPRPYYPPRKPGFRFEWNIPF